MKQRIKTVLCAYGVIVRPWLCVVAYLWILELQSVYGTDFEPVMDSLADAASILWTLIFWFAVFAAFISLNTMWLPPISVRHTNEFVCRVGCVLISAFYLMRWLARWPALIDDGYAVYCGILLLISGLYFLARHQKNRLAGAPVDYLPSWQDCFSYGLLPLLIASVAVIGNRIAESFSAREVATRVLESTTSNQRAAAVPPNVIVIVADSLRAQSLSLYSPSGVATPMIEQLGKTSSVYLDTHSNATMTSPSLTALFTGKHSLHYARLSRELPAPQSDQHLLEILRSHGYTSAAVTSSLDATLRFIGFSSGLNLPENFAFSFLTLSWLRELGVYPTRLGSRMYQELRLLCPWLGFPKRTSTYGELNDTLEQATTIIANVRLPFFLFIHIHEPHEYDSSPSLSMLAQRLTRQLVDKKKNQLEIYTHYDDALQPEVDSYKADYESSVRAVDLGLGNFFNFLRRQPWFDDSLVIITADHGESFERGYLYHGEELYENSTWVPLIIRFPGQKSGARISGLTQTTDIAPTILKTLGLTIPDWMDGQALDREFSPAQVATIAFNHKHPDDKGNYVLPTKLAIWWNRFKLIAGCNDGLVELYDLANDPDEHINLAERERETVEDLKLKLRHELAQQSGPIKLSCANL